MEYIAIFLFSFLLIDLVLSCITYKVAGDKGRNQLGWFFLVLFSSFIGLLFLLIAPDNQEKLDRRRLLARTHNRCPYCDEIVRTSATRCPHCTGDLPEPEQLPELNNTERPADPIKKPSIHSILPTDNLIYDSKECPHCGKRIGSNAERCPHCRTDL